MVDLLERNRERIKIRLVSDQRSDDEEEERRKAERSSEWWEANFEQISIFFHHKWRYEAEKHHLRCRSTSLTNFSASGLYTCHEQVDSYSATWLNFPLNNCSTGWPVSANASLSLPFPCFISLSLSVCLCQLWYRGTIIDPPLLSLLTLSVYFPFTEIPQTDQGTR